MTDYTFELRLCGESGCTLCPTRTVRTPETGDGKLRRNVLRFLALPINDPTNKDKFLSPEEARRRVDAGMTRAEQLKSLPVLKQVTSEKKLLKESKARDRNLGNMFHCSKVRAIACCGECGASRVVCSLYGASSTRKDKPTKEDKERMLRRLEEGYVCGQLLDVPKYHVREAHRCHEPIESQYYATNDTTGGRVLTKNICATCYADNSFVTKQEILRSRKTGGKDILPMCRDCFDAGLPVVTSAASRVNQKKKADEAKSTKRKRMEKIASSVRTKGRKHNAL